MRQLRDNMKQGTFMDKYFMQFICNHIKEVIPSVGSKTKVITQGDNILMPASAASNPILGLNIYMSNQYKNTIYVLASDNAIIIDKHKYYTYKVAGNTIRKKGEPVRYNSNKEHSEMSADVKIRFKTVVPTSSENPASSYTTESLEGIDNAMNYLNSIEEPDIPDNIDDFIAPPHQLDDLSTSQMDEIDGAFDNEAVKQLEEDMQRNPDKYRAIDEYEYNGEPAINYDIDESEEQLSEKICEEP